MSRSTLESLVPSSDSLPLSSLLAASDTFVRRHVGPNADDIKAMLKVIGFDALDDLIEATVPASIRLAKPLGIGEPRGEHELLAELKTVASQNKIFRSFIGQGYYDTIVPPIVLRNILENPGWYTQYTPYQAEISQGRLEALLNYQTMVCDMTGLPLANASLLDEGTAAAEAMAMCVASTEHAKKIFLVASDCHAQTIDCVKTRADSLGFTIKVVNPADAQDWNGVAGILVQYPTTDGRIEDYGALVDTAHKNGAMAVVATDLLALTLLTPPGEFGADIAVGSAQRFGVPMGFGGPHAAFMATKTDHARRMPGRLIGVSKDAQGDPAMRLTLQTREQHIRRERATSNICTAQVLLAIMAGFYAAYHGPHGLKRIAERTHAYARLLAAGAKKLGLNVTTAKFFDTVQIKTPNARAIGAAANAIGYNFRVGAETITLSTDETTTLSDIKNALVALNQGNKPAFSVDSLINEIENQQTSIINRKSDFLTHAVFNQYHAEHEMLRYMTRLQSRDLSLVHSMIPLGSCTMKLNATTEMIPVTWPEFGQIHPFAPQDQWRGYAKMTSQLEAWLSEITGFAATWLQPNAGSQGEYAGLLAIRAYHHSRGDKHRDICLIPTSAHGTNPASAVIAGMKVVPVACDSMGNIDVADLKKKAELHKANLAALMITYPSTHGVFEEAVKEICQIIHDLGGQVYMDGANMNAQVGLTSPGNIGADVCHLNLHKTFCIPHGGGGPGMGPICVAKHLAPFIPKHDGPNAVKPGEGAMTVSAAPYGSASILTISYVYIALMGGAGLKRATEGAILNANYMAKRLESHYPILYRGKNGTCAHEFILDCREIEKTSGVKVEDIAKRLMDYGFHAPTMSWPVGGTLMIEPTESESRAECDKLVDALIYIRDEIRAIEQGKMDRTDNPLKNAPHTAAVVTADEWTHKYTRQQAAYPAPWTKTYKFWPSVGRVDNVYGDRNLVCTCEPMEQE